MLPESLREGPSIQASALGNPAWNPTFLLEVLWTRPTPSRGSLVSSTRPCSSTSPTLTPLTHSPSTSVCILHTPCILLMGVPFRYSIVSMLSNDGLSSRLSPYPSRWRTQDPMVLAWASIVKEQLTLLTSISEQMLNPGYPNHPSLRANPIYFLQPTPTIPKGGSVLTIPPRMCIIKLLPMAPMHSYWIARFLTQALLSSLVLKGLSPAIKLFTRMAWYPSPSTLKSGVVTHVPKHWTTSVSISPIRLTKSPQPSPWWLRMSERWTSVNDLIYTSFLNIFLFILPFFKLT